MNNLTAQKDEILAIKSIFEKDNLILDEDERQGIFHAEPELPETPLNITYTSDKNKESFKVEHLTPIELHFELPSTYPYSSPPRYLITCHWLDRATLSKVCDHLDEIWQENQGEVLYLWFDFLLHELLPFLSIRSTLDITNLIYPRSNQNDKKSENCVNIRKKTTKTKEKISREELSSRANPSSSSPSSTTMATRASTSPPSKSRLFICRGHGPYDQRTEVPYYDKDLIRYLKAFDSTRKQAAFFNKRIDCGICFTPFMGSEAVSFNCDHYYCQTCIKTYLEVQITEGQVHLLNCPKENCDSEADPSIVKTLVNADLYRKYDTMLLSSALGTIGDIVYCPRKHCQKPIINEPNNNLVTCPYCDFAFCALCKYSYHGVSPCRHFVNAEERVQVLTEYEKGSAKERLQLEKSYGKQFLIKQLDEYKCELWMKARSKECPKCRARIEKIDGCNKMHCFRCHTYFCWLCLSILRTDNPYRHFRDTKSPCFSKLFEGVLLDNNDPDDDWEEVGLEEVNEYEDEVDARVDENDNINNFDDLQMGGLIDDDEDDEDDVPEEFRYAIRYQYLQRA